MNETPIQVLLIEDSVVIRSMVKKMLNASRETNFNVIECENLTRGLEKLPNTEIDVIILDLSLPESSGAETVSCVRAIDTNTPIVVFTGNEDENLAMAAMYLGADDYLVKKEVKQGSLLSRTLRYAIEQKRAKSAINKYAIEMERLAEARARQLLHQDRLAAIGTMSAGVAHEIKGPLSYVSNNVRALSDAWHEVEAFLRDVVENHAGESEELEYLLDEAPDIFRDIFVGVDRISDITDGLKKFARKGSGDATPTTIETCVNDALELCKNLLKYGIDVDKQFNSDGLLMPLQQQKMVQVFVNLFYNAAHAMDNQGKLTIATEADGNQLRITVNDTGPGIPDDQLESIWEPFYTTKSEDVGTGLGLSICKEIVVEHGGTITAHNSVKGASFNIVLPIS